MRGRSLDVGVMHSCRSHVLRVSGMPGRVTMWVDHRSGDVYVDDTVVTEDQAWQLEEALAAGRLKVQDILTATAR